MAVKALGPNHWAAKGFSPLFFGGRLSKWTIWVQMLSLFQNQYTGKGGEASMYTGKWVSAEAVWMYYRVSDHKASLTGLSCLHTDGNRADNLVIL